MYTDTLQLCISKSNTNKDVLKHRSQIASICVLCVYRHPLQRTHCMVPDFSLMTKEFSVIVSTLNAVTGEYEVSIPKAGARGGAATGLFSCSSQKETATSTTLLCSVIEHLCGLHCRHYPGLLAQACMGE